MNPLSDQSPKTVPVDFSGKTDEYFRIWIVNMALTIVTLGIYSAWAKVRKTRYFYTHTTVAEGSFDYHAKPTAILFGRVIALLMVGAYFGSSYVHPLAPMIIILTIFAVIPWLVVRSRIFQLRNTSYRNIRFNFRPNYAESFKVFYLGGLVAAISLGLATPTAVYWRNKFAVENSGFGKTFFDFRCTSNEFYKIIYTSIGLTIVGFVIYFFFAMMLSVFAPDPSEISSSGPSAASEIFSLIVTLPIFLVYLAIGVYVQVRLRNYIWNNSKLGDNEFISTLSVTSMVFIYVTNLLAIVFTLGLLTPWAQIRLAKYRADNTKLVLADDWKSYVAAENHGGSALGDEIGEAFDVDVDFGF